MPSQARSSLRVALVVIVGSDLCFTETRCSSGRLVLMKQTLAQAVLAATVDCLPFVCLAWTVFQTSQTVLGSHAHCQGQEKLGEGVGEWRPAMEGVCSSIAQPSSGYPLPSKGCQTGFPTPPSSDQEILPANRRLDPSDSHLTPTPPQLMVSQQMFEDHLKAWLRIAIKSKVQIPNLLQGSGGFGLKAASFYNLPTRNLGLSQGWPSGGGL